MTVSCKSRQGKKQVEGKTGGNGGEIERILTEVKTRAMSRGRNELIGGFKMAAGDAINISGRL